ncbi:MAG: CehA/McbA family metallohydrolase [bacterium]|nr:CehA/McbA family metallohydrolase [bacterium]
MKYSYLGALHVHSTYSDGRKDVDYIVKQAAKAGLKWVIITDHNSLEALTHEGFHNGVCVIAGCEITPPTANHLLAFDIKEPIDYEIGVKNYIDEVHKQGGMCFVAHPDESIHRQNKQAPLRWEDWSIDTFDGIEIWNYLTDWTDRYAINKSLLFQFLFRHRHATGPTKNTLAWWDRLNIQKDEIVPAIGGDDSHAFVFKKFNVKFKIADYYDSFSSLNQILYLDVPLSSDFSEAREQILSAIKSANSIIINRQVCKNTNIEYYVLNKNKKTYSGETSTIGSYSRLVFRIPQKAVVRLIHNGVLVYEHETKILEYDNLESGKYRIEVYKDGCPWIFTNPIKVCRL